MAQDDGSMEASTENVAYELDVFHVVSELRVFFDEMAIHEHMVFVVEVRFVANVYNTIFGRVMGWALVTLDAFGSAFINFSHA